MNREVLQVRGAKVHNLRNVDCQIPHESLTVITGVSGSGKSSLAFDTIYAEDLAGHRRRIKQRVPKRTSDVHPREAGLLTTPACPPAFADRVYPFNLSVP